MHELWLCKSVFAIIQGKAAKTKATKVKKVVLEIGLLAAVDKEALTFSFDVVTKGTLADKAELEIIDIPGEAQCESCHKTFSLQHYYEACDACGSHRLKIIQGEELKVKSMVVE